MSLLFRWDQFAHEGPQVVCEQGIEVAVVDPEGRALDDLDVDESRFGEFVDEVTLRQGS